MSLYNNLFGTNENSNGILALIGLKENFFARFRDVDLIDNGKIIRVFTRTGGGNREYYQKNWEDIRKNKYYRKDYDDDFDCTYAHIEFIVPDDKLETAKSMYKGEPESFEDKFNKSLEDMNDPNSKSYQVGQQIVKQIEEQIKKGSSGVISI